MSNYLISEFSPWLVTVLMAVQLLVVLSRIPVVWKFFWRLGVWIKMLMVLSLLVGGLMRWFWTPDFHRIYFDEDRYLTYAVNFAKFGKEVGLDAATTTTLVKGEPDLVARVTVPTLNAWVMKTFGYSEYVMINFARVMSTLQIALVFACTYLMFKKADAAAVAAAIFGFLPMNVFWANSIALDAYFVMFSLLAFTAACWYARKTTWVSAVFLIASTVNLLYVRLESFLFLGVIAAAIVIIRRKENQPMLTRKDWLLAVIGVPIVGVRALVSISVLGQTWCCGESTPLEVFGSGYFIRNTIPNLEALWFDHRMPWVVTALATYALFGKKDMRIVVLGLWLGFYFFIYSFYYAGMFFTYQFSGSNGRYLLMVLPPLSMLAALSGVELWPYVRKLKQKGKIIFGLGLLLVCWTLVPVVMGYRGLVYLSPYDQLVDAPTRIVHQFLEDVLIPNTPKGSVVVHSLTGYVLMNDRTAVYLASLMYDKKVRQMVIDEARRGVPVYMWQTHTCDFTPDKCEEMNKYFDYVPVAIEGESGPYKFEVVKLELKKE